MVLSPAAGHAHVGLAPAFYKGGGQLRTMALTEGESWRVDTAHHMISVGGAHPTRYSLLIAGRRPWAGSAAGRPWRGSPTRTAATRRSHWRPRDGCRVLGSTRGRGRAWPTPARRRR